MFICKLCSSNPSPPSQQQIVLLKDLYLGLDSIKQNVRYTLNETSVNVYILSPWVYLLKSFHIIIICRLWCGVTRQCIEGEWYMATIWLLSQKANFFFQFLTSGWLRALREHQASIDRALREHLERNQWSLWFARTILRWNQRWNSSSDLHE